MIKNLKIKCDDVPEAKTISDYLCALLCRVWEDRESFSGKRPFGNSGWEYDLYKPLIESGLVDGKINEYDFECFEEEKAHEIILNAIKQVFAGEQK